MRTGSGALILAFALWSVSFLGDAQANDSSDTPQATGQDVDIAVYALPGSSPSNTPDAQSAGGILLAANADGQQEPAKAEDEAASSGDIGSVKTVKGDVSIVSGGQSNPAAVGVRLHPTDVVKTEKDGSVGIILKDDTVISLGPSSELEMKEFKFDPKENEYSFVSRMVKGTFVYVSGLIGKLSPESVKMETPVGIIAVRGTKLLVRIRG